MLFIRRKYVRLGIQAVCLMHEPFAVFHIRARTGMEGFVAAASQLLPIIQLHAEAELLFFYRSYIKECRFPSKNILRFPIFNGNQMNMTARLLPLFSPQQLFQQIPDQNNDLHMGIDIHIYHSRALGYTLTDRPNHPDNS